MEAPPDVTLLLARAREGDADALDRLIPIVYDELRTLARRQRQRRASGETINTTALVHEAYVRLSRDGKEFADRQHFFRVAARAMRGVLVDHARTQGRQKRGGDAPVLSLDAVQISSPEAGAQLLALDEALTRLASVGERLAEIVELRYFIGMSIPETADILGLSESTVKREWSAARAWLHHSLSEDL